LNRIRTVFQDKTRLLALTERNLRFAIRHFGTIDIIHAHVGYPGGYIAGLLSRKYGIPYVITEHMSNFPFKVMIKNNQLIDELKFAYANCSKSISVSSSAADQIESYNIKRPTVIPNMVDEDIFKPADHYAQKENFIFLTVGGLIPRKGHKELLEAISLWKTKPSNVKFKIIGEGPSFSDLINLGKELNIQNQVEWLGALSRDEIVNEFKNCDVFVLPSHLESFGIVYTEALACGKPVIGTKCGGPEDIINDFNGIIVNVGNSIELSSAISFIYNNIDNYNSNKIRTYFLEKFSASAISLKISAIYEEVITSYSYLNK